MAWKTNDGSTWPLEWSVNLVNPETGTLTLRFTIGDARRSQKIPLEATACPLGGFRYFFRCPVNGERITTLCFADGRFQGRRAAKLTYRSQGEGRLLRLIRARDKARARAFGYDGRPMPKGANRQRLELRWKIAEAALQALIGLEVYAWVKEPSP